MSTCLLKPCSSTLRPGGLPDFEVEVLPRKPLDFPCSNRLVKPQRLIECPIGLPLDHAPGPGGGIAQRTLLRQPADSPRAITRSRHLAWAFGSIPSYDLWLQSRVEIPSYEAIVRSSALTPCKRASSATRCASLPTRRVATACSKPLAGASGSIPSCSHPLRFLGAIPSSDPPPRSRMPSHRRPSALHPAP